jgi:hypothetical protein
VVRFPGRNVPGVPRTILVKVGVGRDWLIQIVTVRSTSSTPTSKVVRLALRVIAALSALGLRIVDQEPGQRLRHGLEQHRQVVMSRHRPSDQAQGRRQCRPLGLGARLAVL